MPSAVWFGLESRLFGPDDPECGKAIDLVIPPLRPGDLRRRCLFSETELANAMGTEMKRDVQHHINIHQPKYNQVNEAILPSFEKRKNAQKKKKKKK